MKSFLNDLKTHLLTGISYVFPLLVITAVCSQLSILANNSQAVNLQRLAMAMNTLEELLTLLIFPTLAGFISFSVSDKLGLIPGLAGGLVVYSLGAGFLGSLVIGLLAGYLCQCMKNRIKLPAVFASISPVFLIPTLGTLVPILFFSLIAEPFIIFNTLLLTGLPDLSLNLQVLFAILIAAMVAYDSGGSVNKVAMTISFGFLITDSYFLNTAAQLAIIIPPLGAGVATLLAKKKYSIFLKEAGKRSLLMGIAGISEGVIPFTMDAPKKTRISCMLGSMVGASVAIYYGAVNKLPLSGFYAWFFVDGIAIYLLAIVAGVIVVAFGLIINRQEAPAEEEEEDDEFDEDEWEE